mgnify:CR=1 FL=1
MWDRAAEDEMCFGVPVWDAVEAVRYTGGIDPVEMRAFLGMCQNAKVDAIVESGRGRDAYSTRCLAEYARRTGVVAVSLDWDNRWWNWMVSRTLLWGYRQDVRILVGDAQVELAAIVAGLAVPTAVLVDGPKNGSATNLLKQCVRRSGAKVRVVAQHGAANWSDFEEQFPGAVRTGQLCLARVEAG